MSGHSKWAQIKRQKGTADSKKAARYTKLGHTIALAVRDGGKDAAMNPGLRLALEKAKMANMPSATIERAIKRGAGELGNGAILEEVAYEGFGPGGIAVLVEAVTDNKNRTAADIRKTFSAYGGNMGSAGSVRWMFVPRGVIMVPQHELSEEQELTIIDAGADDVARTDEGLVIYTKPESLDAVRERLCAYDMPPSSAEVTLFPKNTVDIPDDATVEKLSVFLDTVESLDEVNKIVTNATP